MVNTIYINGIVASGYDLAELKRRSELGEVTYTGERVGDCVYIFTNEDTHKITPIGYAIGRLERHYHQRGY